MAIRAIDSIESHEREHRGDSAYVRWVKPTVDRILGLILLVVTAPVIAVAAALMRRRIGSPALFVQERVGRDGRTFLLYKLRTMTADRRTSVEPYQGQDRRTTHKSPTDPRIDPVGSRLRALRIDEFPQFWNVVKGDMSLVGPRPELVEIVAGYEDWQHQRHTVKPGLTGLWQVSHTNGSPMHECTELDLAYVDDMTFIKDLKILARTPLAMLGGRKGY
jgi:lipopolysaccharide/colanic/teichoic acid biosynthesis glycosyltransferase